MRRLADLSFVRPKIRGAKLSRKVGAVILAGWLVTGIPAHTPVWAADNNSPEEVADPRLNELRQELVKLQYQQVLLEGFEKMFTAPKDEGQSAADSEAGDEEKGKLEQAKTGLAQNITNVQIEIQHLQKRLQDYAVAEQVRAASDPASYKNDRYDRTGYAPGIVSDCTWYVAEALKIASDGRIDLNDRNSPFGNWGNAGNWAAHAQSFARANPDGPISGVDKIPQPGDAMEWPDHIAFVEKVQEVHDDNGKLVRYVLTISEENATGSNRAGSIPVKPADNPDGPVKRWRSVLELEVKDGQQVAANLKFIHFVF
jgi:surface antigen